MYFQQNHHFRCVCEVCTLPAETLKESDERRREFDRIEDEIIALNKTYKVLLLNTNAKILKDMKKEKAKKRLTIEDFDRFNQEEKDKDARELIAMKREQKKKEKFAKESAKKKLNTLSSNF